MIVPYKIVLSLYYLPQFFLVAPTCSAIEYVLGIFTNLLSTTTEQLNAIGNTEYNLDKASNQIFFAVLGQHERYSDRTNHQTHQYVINSVPAYPISLQ